MVRVLLAALLLASAAPAFTRQADADHVRIVLKFVKRDGVPAIRFDPSSCPACATVTTPLFATDNARETVIALDVPRRRSLELAFHGFSGAVRRVLLESGELPFREHAGGLIVALPPMARDAVTTAEVATHVVEPGMVLRFEHADPVRRAGAYANGPFPVLQRRAADHLEFAQREVVRQLGLGAEVEREGLGRIQIMGFDTNAPHGHLDAPPHVHMHLRWPNDTGTQIGHFYIDGDGLLTHNLVGVKGLMGDERRIGRGDVFTTVGPDGRGVYSHRITPEGWLQIGRPGTKPCLVRPAGGIGFDKGALVDCPGRSPIRITVTDRPGVLIVVTGIVVEIFRYDPDTGALLSTAAPAPPPSVFVPEPDAP